MLYRLEVYCNLLVLDGNIYDKAPRNSVKQKYIVTLYNTKSNTTVTLGDLVKDGDGIYKLKFVSKKDTLNLVQFDKINILYVIDNNDQLLLTGTFN